MELLALTLSGNLPPTERNFRRMRINDRIEVSREKVVRDERRRVIVMAWHFNNLRNKANYFDCKIVLFFISALTLIFESSDVFSTLIVEFFFTLFSLVVKDCLFLDFQSLLLHRMPCS